MPSNGYERSENNEWCVMHDAMFWQIGMGDRFPILLPYPVNDLVLVKFPGRFSGGTIEQTTRSICGCSISGGRQRWG